MDIDYDSLNYIPDYDLLDISDQDDSTSDTTDPINQFQSLNTTVPITDFDIIVFAKSATSNSLRDIKVNQYEQFFCNIFKSLNIPIVTIKHKDLQYYLENNLNQFRNIIIAYPHSAANVKQMEKRFKYDNVIQFKYRYNSQLDVPTIMQTRYNNDNYLITTKSGKIRLHLFKVLLIDDKFHTVMIEIYNTNAVVCDNAMDDDKRAYLRQDHHDYISWNYNDHVTKASRVFVNDD
ncbi:Hypothetical protein MVR_LOCUS372 [uncultured virus]|nr:Hypothetical protein MVR_LOCUS372 [uncultured virus]